MTFAGPRQRRSNTREVPTSRTVRAATDCVPKRRLLNENHTSTAKEFAHDIFSAGADTSFILREPLPPPQRILRPSKLAPQIGSVVEPRQQAFPNRGKVQIAGAGSLQDGS